MNLNEELPLTEKRRYEKLFVDCISASDNKDYTVVETLHEDIGSEITALKLFISNLNLSHDLKTELDKKLRNVLSKIRNLSAALYPQAVDELGFIEALKINVRKLQELTDKKIKLKVNELSKLPMNKNDQRSLYYVIEEVLTNNLKHSNCSTIDVLVQSNEEKIQIEVNDNGQGFEIDRSQFFTKCELGLQKVFSRIQKLGGTIEFNRVNPVGTNVKVSVNYEV